MQRLTAPGLPAGALAAGGNSFELLKSIQSATAGRHITAEDVADQSMHGGVFPKRRLPCPLLQGVVDGEAEVGHGFMATRIPWSTGRSSQFADRVLQLITGAPGQAADVVAVVRAQLPAVTGLSGGSG